MSVRDILINPARSHFVGHINKHLSNLEVLLENPAGIGEHQDIQEAIEIELGHVADYYDKLEMLTKFFMLKQEEDTEDESGTTS